MLNFKPAPYLQNQDLQTLLGASELRKQRVLARSQPLLRHSESTLLRTEQGIRLQAEYSKNPKSNKKLAVLLHGWEGSANSAYIVGCGQALFDLGYNVARLNLRDHGDTHHLNQSPFNSVRLDEVAEAVFNLVQRHPNEGVVLLGFSLGGNFVLRLSAHAKLKELRLEKTIAICPAIDPLNTSRTIEEGSWIYHRYFLNKWRNSLNKKYRYYPEIMRSTDDLKVKRLNKMNEVFVPLHTDFEKTDDYLSAYRITQATLDGIGHSCDIIYSDDDPIISASDYDHLKPTTQVNIHTQNHGGHCAFLQDWHMSSWIESIIPTLLETRSWTGNYGVDESLSPQF